MKLIIIEGVDRLGKSTIIEGICKELNFDNVLVRHFGKPPKGMTPQEVLDFQFKCFDNEANLIHEMRRMFHYSKYHYYDDTIIWNRSHLGEFVYSQMFRSGNPKELKDKLLFWERFHLNYKNEPDFQIYLITLTADPQFALRNEDGHSFSQTIEQKVKEIELFNEVHEFSTIEKKLIVKVDQLDTWYSDDEDKVISNNRFRSKQEILTEVLNFIK